MAYCIFLMQAKIEPGNVNKIRLSPTIQATKSNFTQKHGGAKPPYLDFFVNAANYEIVVDQIQSEQSSRFFKKRNRNIIIRVEDEVEQLPSQRWLTLGQIKRLMREENLVNMDTRTVLSCIPYAKLKMNARECDELRDLFADKALFASVFEPSEKNTKLVEELKARGVMAYICYVPLHSAPKGRQLGYVPENCPVTEEMGSRVLRLPLYADMTVEDAQNVVRLVEEILAE